MVTKKDSFQNASNAVVSAGKSAGFNRGVKAVNLAQLLKDHGAKLDDERRA